MGSSCSHPIFNTSATLNLLSQVEARVNDPSLYGGQRMRFNYKSPTKGEVKSLAFRIFPSSWQFDGVLNDSALL